ncbi:MAG TPA: proton-conducting transporter membrane subunit, partial [Streptosporangiaceae bacterium]|nr:proton-conducting transporter membrane subunit [Streptosporangiaceae bacterium]
ASLVLSMLYLFGQRDVKRLLAYSSVEHMGILAVGVSFGAPAALAGVLLHVLAHAAAKGNAFMGAGVLVRKLGTKQISVIRGGLDLLPWSGPLFLLAVFALGAMPPFGLFRSEFEIVAGGLRSGSYATAAILIIAVTTAFFGLAGSVTRMMMLPLPRPRASVPDRIPVAAGSRAEGLAGPEPKAGTVTGSMTASLTRGEPSAWMVVPVAAGAVALLWLGLHPPAVLDELFTRAVALLGGGAS